ncbi:ABC transporter permease [Actinomyces sp. B33]|uniref:ABC transporter permease n=1 Tax=Actinomyces sp. B33 TaxID=2942131 RepID=UPI00234195D6|nr:ABC transporter permease [Actinomyces sp. B33]MDC4232524.1 ABC transporter permease [Actinomyces sp. B33]
MRFGFNAKKATEKLLRGDRDTAMLVTTGLILYFGLGALLGARFYSIANFQSMAIQMSSLGLLSLAMSLAMLSGGIDLSIVSIAAVSSIAGAYVMSGDLVSITASNDLPLTLAGIVTILIVATLCGATNGLLISRFSVPPILATLGTMIFFSGIALAATNGNSIGVATSSLSSVSTLTIAAIPISFLVIVLAFGAMWYLLSRRRVGRRIYLIGESITAARFSGIRTDSIKFRVYTISGFLSGIAAVLMLASQNSAREGFGESYQLQAILVAVLAGFDPDGGRGRVPNVLLAVIVLQSLQSAFSILGYSPFAKTFVWGVLLLGVMVLNFYLRRRSHRRSATFG